VAFRTPNQVIKEDGIDLWAEVRALKAQGIGVTEIARDYNIKIMTMAKFINKEEAKEGQEDTGRGSKDLHTYALEKYGKNLPDLLKDWLADPTMTGPVMAKRLNCTNESIHYWMKKYNLKITRKESHKRTILTGRRNYKVMVANGRKTLLRRAVKGSLAAENIYNYLQTRLLDKPFPDFDLVAGMNQWNIIPPKEVDIAIVAIRQDRLTRWGAMPIPLRLKWTANFITKAERNVTTIKTRFLGRRDGKS
jgi:hypothetical protein